MYYTTDYISPLGRVKLTADGRSPDRLAGRTKSTFGGKVKRNSWRQKPVLENAELAGPVFSRGKKPRISNTALAPIGDAFQQGVRTSLRDSLWAVTTARRSAKNGSEDGRKSSMSARRSEGSRP